jgi:hypothetical protein
MRQEDMALAPQTRKGLPRAGSGGHPSWTGCMKYVLRTYVWFRKIIKTTTMIKESKFDDIRPYYDEEIPAAMQRIASSTSFPLLASYVFPE